MDEKSQHENEIDLLAIIETLWEGKWKILIISLVSVIFVVIFQQCKTPQFQAITAIKPISSSEEEPYELNNSFGLFKVDSTLLQNLYIEQLNKKDFFVSAIRKFDLIDKDNYESQPDLNKAIIKLASSITIQPPPDTITKEYVKKYWHIAFTYHNESQWEDALHYVENEANKNVRNTLSRRFNTMLEISRNKKKIELEEISTQITNALNDYNKQTSQRLAYLKEQAAIARQLDVARSTIESQRFGNQNGLVTNVKSDTPFYLRGYEAIEKEIELILLREDKSTFVSGLLALEQKQRSIQQDKTVERAEAVFSLTPIATNDGFTAASMEIEETQFKYPNRIPLIFVLIAGGIIGAAYVLISKAISARKR